MGFEIAIDGPSGSGKSSIAKELAKELGFVYVDTGAMYRAVALFCQQNGINTQNEQAVLAALPQIKIEVSYLNGSQIVETNGVDVTNELRKADIGVLSSQVAVFGKVRECVVALSRELSKRNCVIMDGRDIGTFVLPHADVKIYLDASLETRANRRCYELECLGLPFSKETIQSELAKRDENDKNRTINPLKQAEDAVFIDTSNLTKTEVLETILAIVHAKLSSDETPQKG